MRIENTGVEFHRSEAAKAVQGPSEAGQKQGAKVSDSGASREDKVQISDAGRALAAQHSEATQASRGTETLSSGRVSEIRQRVLSGAYDSVEVVDQVARRMLERGDI